MYYIYCILYHFSRKIFKYYDLNKKSYFILKNFIAFENNIILILMVNMFLIISFFYLYIINK